MADVEAVESPALKSAKDQLGGEMYPAPEDCLRDLSPITSLFYVQQWLEALLGQWIGASVEATDEPEDAQEQIGQVLVTVGEAGGMLLGACALMGLVPGEADGS